MRTLEFDRHPHVLRLGRQVREAEAESVGAELFDHVERIDAVALRFRHRFAIAVENFRRDIDLVERHFADVVQAGDHHPGDPERDDVARRDERAGGIELFQLRRFIWPAHRGDGPEGGGKPGIEDVGFLGIMIDRNSRDYRGKSVGRQE